MADRNTQTDTETHLGPTRNDVDTPDEIEIEIAAPGEEGEPDAAEQGGVEPDQRQAEQPARQEPRRPRSDPQRRIDQAVARQRASETAAETYRRQNEEMLASLTQNEQALSEERQARERGERAALLNHERAVNSDIAIAQRDLQHAIETGDVPKQIAATGAMSRLEADKREIEIWKSANPERPAQAAQPAEQRAEARADQQRQQPQARPIEQQIEALPDAARDWIDSNPWFRPSTQNNPNPDFSQDMYSEATNYAARYEQRLKQSGRQAEINTPAYFLKIQSHMQNEFPEYFEGEDGDVDGDGSFVVPAIQATTQPPTRELARQRAAQQNGRMPQMTRSNAVLPANGQQPAPGAKPAQPQRMRVQMSEDEKILAVKQWEAGAMGNHHQTGKPIKSAAEATDQWAFRKAQRATGART